VYLQWAALVFAIAGVVLFALGLAVRSAGTLGLGLAVIGAGYAVLFVAEGESLDRFTPAFAAGLMLVAELGFWSIEPRIPAWSEPAVAEWRLAGIAGACVGAAVLAALALVAAAGATGTGGLAVESLGVVAALGAVVLIIVLVGRRPVDS
jgi:hypothetical protein